MIWISIIGLVFNFVGSIFFGITVINQKQKITVLSGSFWGSNPNVKPLLQKESKIGIIGLLFLCSGFLMQLIYVIIIEFIK